MVEPVVFNVLLTTFTVAWVALTSIKVTALVYPFAPAPATASFIVTVFLLAAPEAPIVIVVAAVVACMPITAPDSVEVIPDPAVEVRFIVTVFPFPFIVGDPLVPPGIAKPVTALLFVAFDDGVNA